MPADAPLSIDSVTRDHLPPMVLTQEDLEREFPGIPLDDDSGYRDNDSAAESTIDPDDDSLDIQSLGRLDGYDLGLFDIQAIVSGSDRPDGVFIVQSSVDLFATSESATDFVERETKDMRRLEGTEIEGVTLTGFEEFAPPDLGDFATGARFVVTVSAVGAEIRGFSTLVWWTRGPIVAAVNLSALKDTDQTGAIERLVLRMDERIDGVLSGEITEAPIIPSPVSVVVLTPDEQTALPDGYDLRAMLPALADLPDGVSILSDGYTDSDGIATYEREFEAENLVFELGSSQVMNLSTTVELQATDLDASAPILFLNAVDPQVFGDLTGPAFAEAAGFTPENLVFERVELQVGDEAAGFLMKIETALADFDAFLLFFAQGRVNAFLLATGPAGEVALEDVTGLAELIGERIVEHSPP